jgi:hypothetical protein
MHQLGLMITTFSVKRELKPGPARKLHTYHQRPIYSFVVQARVRIIKAITRDAISGGKLFGEHDVNLICGRRPRRSITRLRGICCGSAGRVEHASRVNSSSFTTQIEECPERYHLARLSSEQHQQQEGAVAAPPTTHTTTTTAPNSTSSNNGHDNNHGDAVQWSMALRRDASHCPV